MHNGSAAECAVACDTAGIELETLETKGRELVLRLKSIPWARVIVDALLLASLLAVSSSVLLQR
jgi:hypothetical protein